MTVPSIVGYKVLKIIQLENVFDPFFQVSSQNTER